MPAVEESDLAAAVRDLGENSGGKTLRQVLAGERGAVAGDADLQAMDDAPQIGLVVRGLPEAADHRRGRPHRGQALAAHIADEQPDPVRRVGRLIEVATDPGLLLGRQIQRLDLDVLDEARQGRSSTFWAASATSRTWKRISSRSSRTWLAYAAAKVTATIAAAVYGVPRSV